MIHRRGGATQYDIFRNQSQISNTSAIAFICKLPLSNVHLWSVWSFFNDFVSKPFLCMSHWYSTHCVFFVNFINKFDCQFRFRAYFIRLDLFRSYTVFKITDILHNFHHSNCTFISPKWPCDNDQYFLNRKNSIFIQEICEWLEYKYYSYPLKKYSF